MLRKIFQVVEANSNRVVEDELQDEAAVERAFNRRSEKSADVLGTVSFVVRQVWTNKKEPKQKRL